jgi:DNA-binding NarL/FixJ family response regulator
VISDEPMRVLVVDNDPRVRSALHTLLEQQPGTFVVRDSSDLDGIAGQLKDFRPNVMLLDWELPGRPAAAVLLALRGCTVEMRVIVLSKRAESEDGALAAGACAFVSKSEPPERLLDLLRAIRRDLADDARREVQPC